MAAYVIAASLGCGRWALAAPVALVVLIASFLSLNLMVRGVLGVPVEGSIALFFAGAALSLFTGRRAFAGGLRMVLIGGGAPADSYLRIDRLLAAARASNLSLRERP